MNPILYPPYLRSSILLPGRRSSVRDFHAYCVKISRGQWVLTPFSWDFVRKCLWHPHCLGININPAREVRKDKPTCFRLLTQLMRWARALARASAGSNMAARIAMMAITTNNSIRVKAPIFLRGLFIDSAGSFLLFVGVRARGSHDTSALPAPDLCLYLSNADATNIFLQNPRKIG